MAEFRFCAGYPHGAGALCQKRSLSTDFDEQSYGGHIALKYEAACALVQLSSKTVGCFRTDTGRHNAGHFEKATGMLIRQAVLGRGELNRLAGLG